MSWVSLVHLGTWLPMKLDKHFSEELGISLSEQDLLSQLDMAGGKIRMTELAERLFLSKPGMTRMLDRLEKSKFAKRVQTPGDRRSLSAELTKKGENILSKSRELLLPWVEENFGSRLNKAELKEFGHLLEKILESHNRWEGQLEHLGRKSD